MTKKQAKSLAEDYLCNVLTDFVTVTATNGGHITFANDVADMPLLRAMFFDEVGEIDEATVKQWQRWRKMPLMIRLMLHERREAIKRTLNKLSPIDVAIWNRDNRYNVKFDDGAFVERHAKRYKGRWYARLHGAIVERKNLVQATMRADGAEWSPYCGDWW